MIFSRPSGRQNPVFPLEQQVKDWHEYGHYCQRIEASVISRSNECIHREQAPQASENAYHHPCMQPCSQERIADPHRSGAEDPYTKHEKESRRRQAFVPSPQNGDERIQEAKAERQ